MLKFFCSTILLTSLLLAQNLMISTNQNDVFQKEQNSSQKNNLIKKIKIPTH